MFPRLFSLGPFELFGSSRGPFTLHTYGLLLAIGFLAGLWIAGRQARRSGLDGEKVGNLGIAVLIAGLLGAKIMLIVVEWNYYSAQFSQALAGGRVLSAMAQELLSVLQSGGVFYGGLIGALPVAWWYARKYQLPGWSTADALAPGVILGQAIGRLGCFAAGCCHGRPASVPWAVTYTDPYAAKSVGTPLGVAVHPTQIYETIAAFIILAILLKVASRRRFEGQVVLSYVVLYAIARFTIEIFRGDAVRGFVFGGALSTSQFIAVLMLVGAAIAYPLARRRAARPAEAVAPAPVEPQA
jgi:phosphatidylglycerol:prolipoprotein diacylglycerol transferase